MLKPKNSSAFMEKFAFCEDSHILGPHSWINVSVRFKRKKLFPLTQKENNIPGQRNLAEYHMMVRWIIELVPTV